MPDPVRQARDEFRAHFGHAPSTVAVAPGRVNLIGEHTDYNDGFVLPMGIDRFVAVALGPGRVGELRARASSFAETHQVPLAALDPQVGHDWMAYVSGVAWAMREQGVPIEGVDLAIAGDVPIGAGLASSAALAMAVARALGATAGIEWDARRMARLGQRVEHEFAGVACGIMDPLAAAASIERAALLIDCRTLAIRPIPLPDPARIVVLDTGVRRALGASAYNDRRESCERALDAVRGLAPQVTALRDVDAELLARARARMDPATYRRASHVVAEIPRPAAMAAALAAHDLARAGRLMDASHASLRDLYDVSCPELDAMVEEARRQPGCFGARMTGAGFGGCAVALVEADRTGEFREAVAAGYRARTGRDGRVFVCRPAGGARVL